MKEVRAHVAGSVWKVVVGVGDAIEVDDVVVILESMKMELEVESEVAGTVREILCQEGQAVQEDQPLVLLE